MRTTAVFDSYWRFAAERQAILEKRLAGLPPPWTDDPVLARYRFTNPYRFTDRVSQYLIRAVQNGPDRPPAPREVFFRTLLFKLFNRIETWEAIEAACGPVTWDGCDLERIAGVLDELRGRGVPVYNAAYVMPPPGLGAAGKHRDHLRLLARLMAARVPERVAQAPDLASVDAILRGAPGLGPFLAFQFTIDLNYSGLVDFPESSYVVAGPGARDGIAKCFADRGGLDDAALIRWTAAQQDEAFARRGLTFRRVFDRPLQLVDCQNLFCEISKYARVAYPDIGGATGRARIKQGFRPGDRPLPPLMPPPKWDR